MSIERGRVQPRYAPRKAYGHLDERPRKAALKGAMLPLRQHRIYLEIFYVYCGAVYATGYIPQHTALEAADVVEGPPSR